jgi:hypothetical protein
MRTRTAAILLGVVAALAAAPLVWGQVTNRYLVASDPDARGYARNLSIVIVSPPKYVLDYAGRLGNDAQWKGPRYEATERPSLGGLAGLGWSADIELAPSNRATVRKNLLQGWEVVASGTDPVERRVGGRVVGSLPGTWLITQGSVMAGEARYEGGIVFPLCGRTALVEVSALTPAGDSAGGAMGFGDYVIEGMKPTEWNRAQVLATLRAVRLEGNLPAGRVTARRRGGSIAGSVTDCNRHALAGQAVIVQRRVGRAWQVVSRGKTTASGSYSVAARGTGPFRVVAGTRRSGSIR